jgi:hypothetical protein
MSRRPQQAGQRIERVFKALLPTNLFVSSSDRGFAFLAILPQILLLGALTALIVDGARRDLLIAGQSLDRYQSELATETAIQLIIFARMTNRQKLRTESQNKGGTLAVKTIVEREASKISIGRLPNPILARLADVVCMPASDRAHFKSWQMSVQQGMDRLPDKQATNPPDNNIRSFRYRALSDLRRQSKISRESYLRLRPYITRYGLHVRPELMGAALPVVMAALNMPQHKARSIVSSTPKQTSIDDRTGILSITAWVSDPQKPPMKTRAVVYLTGQPEQPYKLLEIQREEIEAEPYACTFPVAPLELKQ